MQGTTGTIKTTLLLGALTGVFVLIGSAIGGIGGMMIAFILAVFLNMGTWWFSEALMMTLQNGNFTRLSVKIALHCS